MGMTGREIRRLFGPIEFGIQQDVLVEEQCRNVPTEMCSQFKVHFIVEGVSLRKMLVEEITPKKDDTDTIVDKNKNFSKL